MPGQTNSPPWALTATDIVARYQAQSLSPVDVLDSVLNRLDQINPLINAVVTLDTAGARKSALDAAHRWHSGKPLSAIDGVPITVKDNLNVKGMRSTWGSLLCADFVPDKDELPIARLRAAGAVIFGKTNCPEFTLQGYADNLLFGPTRNPWSIKLTPGGSSGGAVAAVAAGIGPVAIGTDGGGSIRRPASYTNLVGLKPSRGRVPRCDGFPSVLLDFETVGPIARTTDDVALIMKEMSAPDTRDFASGAFLGKPLTLPEERPCRILYVPRFGNAPVDPEITSGVTRAAARLAAMGHLIEQGAVPFDMAAVDAAWTVISQTGLARLSQNWPSFDQNASPALREIAKMGLRLSAAQYLDALWATRSLERCMANVFNDHDLIMTPSAAALPWPAEQAAPHTIDGESVGGRGHAVFTAFVNMSGCAGINIPCGFSSGGLPIGFQFVAPPGDDGLLLTLAKQCERAAFWTPGIGCFT